MILWKQQKVSSKYITKLYIFFDEYFYICRFYCLKTLYTHLRMRLCMYVCVLIKIHLSYFSSNSFPKLILPLLHPNFIWSVFKSTESTQWYLYMNRCRILYESMDNLSGTVTLRKTDCPSPKHYQLPITSQLWVELHKCFIHPCLNFGWLDIV